jgi:hypothetical protein
MEFLGTIQSQHVGQKPLMAADKAFASKVMSAIGPIQRGDIGKQAWLNNGVVQVENRHQRDARLA